MQLVKRIAACISNIDEPALRFWNSYAFIGEGKCSDVANLAANTMSSLGRPAIALAASSCLHGSLGSLSLPECVIAISKSGKTKETIEVLTQFEHLWPGKPAYMLTCNANADEGSWSNIFIGYADELNSFSPTTSSVMFVAWLMAYCEQARTFTKEQWKLCHPANQPRT